MKLNIPPLSQKDSRWGRKRLGTSTVTISNYGCLLTCHSMMLIYYGHEECLPDVLNELYKTKKVFDQGNLINFYAAANCFEDITVDEHYNCYDVPCDLSKIDKYLAEKKPVIALVDFSPKTGIQTHFVLIIGHEGNDYLINDPWTGETYFFSAKYGDAARFIFGLRLYSGELKEENLEDTISDLETKVKSLNEENARKSLENNELRTALENQERDNKDLSEQLVKARSERNKIDGEKKVLETKVKDVEKQVVNLKKGLASAEDTVKTLRSELATSQARQLGSVRTLELLRELFIRRLFWRR